MMTTRSTMRYVLPLLALATLLGSMLPGPTLSAQTPFVGRKFMVAFPDTVRDNVPLIGAHAPSAMRLVMFATGAGQARAHGNGVDDRVSLTATASSTVNIDGRAAYLDSGKSADRVITIESDVDIILYCYFETPDGSEAFTPLPVARWGTRYLAAMGPSTTVGYRPNTQEEGLQDIPAPAQVIVIASQNGTSVSIGGDAPVKLNAGECYVAEGRSAYAGSSITADKPVGIMTGNTRGGSKNTYTGSSIITGNTLKNTMVEWLTPVEMHGITFAAVTPRSIAPDPNGSDLLLTLMSTPWAVTTTQVGIDPNKPVDRSERYAGQFNEVELINFLGPDYLTGFDVVADHPISAFAIVGSAIKSVWEIEDQRTWTSAMVELQPFERWVTTARFHAFDAPSFLQNYVLISCEKGATVRVDGVVVPLVSPYYPLTTFSHGRLLVAPGDHVITSTGGKFTAIAYGVATGVEQVRPGRPRKDDGGGSTPLHTTFYSQLPAYCYAYPVVGLTAPTIPPLPKGLNYSIITGCDTMVVMITSTAGADQPVTANIAQVNGTNSRLRIDTIRTGSTITALRVVVSPINPKVDAALLVVGTGPDGGRKDIPYVYHADVLDYALTPASMNNVPAGVPIDVTLTIDNNNAYPVWVSNGQLARATQGFQIKKPEPFPLLVPPNGSVTVPLLFQRVDHDTYFSDDIVLSLECRTDTVHLQAKTAPAPAPRIGGCDWRARWLTTLDSCTKSGVRSYDSTLPVFNLGLTDITVTALDLIGPDADDGYFTLDRTDPATTVAIGTLLPGGDTSMAGHILRQTVRFRPKQEREYSCLARLITSSDDTVWSTLRGVGIESHPVVTGWSFAPVDLTGKGAPDLIGTATIAARGTRPLTIMRLTVEGPDRSRFAIDQADLDQLPKTLAPGDIWRIGAHFRPIAPGRDTAWIVAETDGSRCDDSLGGVDGSAFIRGIGIDSIDLGTMLGCHTSGDTILLRNTGSVDARLVGIDIVPPGILELDNAALPVDFPAGGEIRLPLRVIRRDSGDFRCAISSRIAGLAASGGDTVVTTTVTGRIVEPGITAAVGRAYHAVPGQELVVPVLLRVEGSGIEGAHVRSLRIRVRYNAGILRLLNGGDPGTLAGALLSGWTLTGITDRRGELELFADASAPAELTGDGELLRLRFRSFLGDSTGSEIIPEVAPIGDAACLTVDVVSGHFQLDSICGLTYRLFELGTAGRLLGDAHPNPFRERTEISFTVPFDAPVRIALVDAAGHEVAVPLERDLPAGAYRLEIGGDRLPSGLYFYTLGMPGTTETRSVVRSN